MPYNIPVENSQIPLKQLAHSEGQEALDQAPRRSDGKLCKFPVETAKEIKEFIDVGMPIPEIAKHFGITEKQIAWVIKPEYHGAAILGTPDRPDPEAKPKKKPEELKSVGISLKSYKWVSGLSTTFNVRRGEILDTLVNKARGDKKFLESLLKGM